MLWELLFMMVILKLPIVYLVCVVVWAIRAEPKPLEGAPLLVPAPENGPAAPCPWRTNARSRRRIPHPPRPRLGDRGRLTPRRPARAAAR